MERMIDNSVYADREKRDQVYRLIDTVWPGDYEVIQLTEKLGVPWHVASTPFVRFDGNRAISHVGVLQLTMTVCRTEVLVGGIHAVCTHPDYRGRGYNRQVMQEALQHCESRFHASLLFTDEPTIYTRYGFRTVEEHIFEATDVPAKKPTGDLRRLSATSPRDLALLKRLALDRTPVSNVVGVLESGGLLVTNELFSHPDFERIHYSEEINCVIVFEVNSNVLQLYDIVGPQIPPLDEIASLVSADFERVEIHFSPDLLHVNVAQTKPRPTGDYLMVRGAIDFGTQPFAIPPLARC